MYERLAAMRVAAVSMMQVSAVMLQKRTGNGLFA